MKFYSPVIQLLRASQPSVLGFQPIYFSQGKHPYRNKAHNKTNKAANNRQADQNLQSFF